MSYYIDTHCHIYMDKYNDMDIVKDSISENIKKILILSDNTDSFEKVITLKKDYSENVDIGLGIHPHYAETVKNLNLDIIKSYQNIITCIGEIGIDLHYTDRTLNEQLTLLDKQLHLARDLQKPIIMHLRNSQNEFFEFVKNITFNNSGILHCFSGNKEDLKKGLDKNFYISFAGNITFKNAEKLRDILKYVPLNRLFFETDSPYLTPVPKRGKLNYPKYVKYIYQFSSNILNVDIDTLQKQIIENYNRLFKLNNNSIEKND